jgi:hypothetical protein
MIKNRGVKRFIVLGVALLFGTTFYQSSAGAENRLEVMGFYLGMTADNAVNNLHKLGINNYNAGNAGISFGKDMGNWLQFDYSNKVNYMLFTYKLFDAQDLYLNDFVKLFSNNYHLAMKYDSLRDAFVYQNKNCEVLIPSDPMGIVIIQAIPQAEFNVKG